MPFRDFVILIVVCLAWGANVVVSKIAIGVLGQPPLFYAVERSVVVALVLLPWLIRVPERPFRVLLITLMIGSGSFALLFIGLRSATPSAAAVVNLLGPPLTVLFAVLLLGERLGWRRVVGIAMTMAGVAIVVIDPERLHGSFGLLYVALSTLVGALGAVLLKQLNTSPLQLQAWGGAAGILVLLPLSLLTETGQWHAMTSGGWDVVAAVGFSALVVSVGAHTTYYRLLQKHDANLLAPITLLAPIFSIILGGMVTGDPIGLPLVIGAVIAMAGVLVILIRPSRTFPKRLLVRLRF